MPFGLLRPDGSYVVMDDIYRSTVDPSRIVELDGDGRPNGAPPAPTYTRYATNLPNPNTIRFEDINPQYFQEDFRGFTLALRSQYGGSAVFNFGEDAMAALWQQGRTQYGIDSFPGEINTPEPGSFPSTVPGGIDDGPVAVDPTQAILDEMRRQSELAAQRAAEAEAEATRARQESARAYLEGLLDRYGLGSLGGWAWERIVAGDPNEKILQEMRETTQYKNRFPAMQARRTAGLAPISEEEYINLERSYREVLAFSQMPTGFYDQQSDFTELIGSDLSPALLMERIQEGYLRVTQTAPEVREAFRQYYGVAGDAALAALYLDPDKGSQTLIRQAQAAVAGGIASQTSIDIDRALAEEVSAFNPTAAQLRAGFGNVDALRPLTVESVSENQDITLADSTRAQFGLDSDARSALQRRIQTRRAAFSGGGGAAVTQRGFLGLGTN